MINGKWMNFPKYPKYKDVEVNWIDRIPNNWNLDKIKRTSYVKGRIGWHGLTSEEYQDEGAYLVTGTDFLNGLIDWNSCHHVNWQRYKEDPYIHLKEDDLLITKDGTIGKVAIVKNMPSEATLNTGIFLVRPLEQKYKTDYMYWILNSLMFERFCDYVKTGATIAHLYQETFGEFVFPIPSLKEQSLIADLLRKKTEELDSLIDDDQQLIELLKEKRAALVNNAVTRGVDSKVELKDSGIEWLGKIPTKWTIKKLKHVATLKSGKNITSDQLDETGKFPVYGGNGLRGYFSKYTHEGSFILIGRQGALCGNINYAKGKFWASEHAVVVTLKKENNLVYFGELLRTMNLNRYSHSAAQPGLSVEEIAALPVPVPPSEEQDKIAEFINNQISKIDYITAKIENRIEILREYKKSLINDVVTGKIDVRYSRN